MNPINVSTIQSTLNLDSEGQSIPLELPHKAIACASAGVTNSGFSQTKPTNQQQPGSSKPNSQGEENHDADDARDLVDACSKDVLRSTSFHSTDSVELTMDLDTLGGIRDSLHGKHAQNSTFRKAKFGCGFDALIVEDEYDHDDDDDDDRSSVTFGDDEVEENKPHNE